MWLIYYAVVCFFVCGQSLNDDLRVSKAKLESYQRIEETHLKQLKFLEQPRQELEHQIQNMHADNNALKSGKNAKSDTLKSYIIGL